MNSGPPPMFWRRMGIAAAILASGPAGGLFLSGVVRLLAFACGVEIDGDLRGVLLVFAVIAAGVCTGVTAHILTTMEDA